MKLHVGKPYDVLFTNLTKLCFFDNFMVSFVNFSRSHDYENFSCCFHDKNGCYAMCYVIVFKARAV